MFIRRIYLTVHDIVFGSRANVAASVLIYGLSINITLQTVHKEQQAWRSIGLKCRKSQRKTWWSYLPPNPSNSTWAGHSFPPTCKPWSRNQTLTLLLCFGSRWNPNINPKGDAVFIDRDPTRILNCIRTGKLHWKNLTQDQLELLRKEVDFLPNWLTA